MGPKGYPGPRGNPGPPGPPGLPTLYLWRNTPEEWAAFRVSLIPFPTHKFIISFRLNSVEWSMVNTCPNTTLSTVVLVELRHHLSNIYQM